MSNQDTGGKEICTLTGGAAQIDANGVLVTGTRWCVQLNFVTPLIQGETVTDHSLIKVNLGWTLTKALHTILAQQLKVYEELEGEVFLPRSFTTDTALATTKKE